MFLPSSVRIAIYISLCSFPISDGWQQKKPLHPPKTHSFRLSVCFPFQCFDPLPQLLVFFDDIQRFFRVAFSAANIKASYPCFSDPAVQRIYRNLKFIRCIYRTYLFASFTACTLYSFSYCLFSDIPFPSIFSFPILFL